jgi:hypothetical protein
MDFQLLLNIAVAKNFAPSSTAHVRDTYPRALFILSKDLQQEERISSILLSTSAIHNSANPNPLRRHDGANESYRAGLHYHHAGHLWDRLAQNWVLRGM